MKRLILPAIIILTLCICGCGAPAESKTEPVTHAGEAGQSTASPPQTSTAPVPPVASEAPGPAPDPEMDPCTYEVTARLHESMPEYRFVASGLTRGATEWSAGYIMGLEGYDENGLSILSADFTWVFQGVLEGNQVYSQMMDTMGLHIVDVNFDGYKDVIILESFSGAHSNTWYNCWLWDSETAAFAASESFSQICNPALDADKKCIYSAGGSGAGFWGGSIYRFIDGEFALTNDLYTTPKGLIEKELVNGEMEIVREVSFSDPALEPEKSEKQTRREQQYYIDSELWQLAHPRWYWYGGHHADQWLE